MNTLDDDAAALQDIANSPDISPGETAIGGKKPLNLKAAGGNVAPDDGAAERNARIFTGNLGKAVKSVSGNELDRDQMEAATELAGMAFAGLMSLGLPRLVYGGMLTAIMILPFAPPLWKLVMASTKKKEDQNG